MPEQTLDSIIEEIKTRVQRKEDISPRDYLDYAAEMNILLLDLDNELMEAEMLVNKGVSAGIEGGLTVSAAKSHMKATDAYKTLLGLQAKRKRAEGQIQIAKQRSQLARWDS